MAPVTVGRLKAKDIREQLRGKIDPAVLNTLEMLAEQDGVLRHQMMQLAELVDKTQDTLQQLIGIMGVATSKIDAVDKMKNSAITLIEKQEIQE